MQEAKLPGARSIYFWNATGSTLSALSSVVFLLLVTRLIGPFEAGIFSLAAAVSNQAWTIVNYEMTTFQATDLEDQFSFAQYLAVRVVLILTAMLFAAGKVLFSGYDAYKAAAVLLMCLFRSLDGGANVFVGLFQRHDRLDIAGKLLSLRSVLAMVSFGLASALWGLLPGISVMCAVYLLCLVLFEVRLSVNYAHFSLDFNPRRLGKLLWLCFPLFAGSFISIFLTNEPKYAIDALLPAEEQTVYNILVMPAAVINLLSLFLMRPALVSIARNWQQGAFAKVKCSTLVLCMSVLLLTAVCAGGAYLAGIPVLEFIYGISLSGYKAALVLTMLAGGMSAFVSLAYSLIAVIRKQKPILIFYLISALVSFALSRTAVAARGIDGAAGVYLLSMGLLAVLLLSYLFVQIYRKKT